MFLSGRKIATVPTQSRCTPKSHQAVSLNEMDGWIDAASREAYASSRHTRPGSEREHTPPPKIFDDAYLRSHAAESS